MLYHVAIFCRIRDFRRWPKKSRKATGKEREKEKP
jgi:hypothetical protein